MSASLHAGLSGCACCGRHAARERTFKANGAAVLPTLLLGAMPKCPACWPLYGAVLQACGLGFLLETAWLVPLLILAVALLLLNIALRHRGRERTLVVGVAAPAAMLVLLGRLAFDAPWCTWLGIGVLAAISVRNALQRSGRGACECAHVLQGVAVRG